MKKYTPQLLVSLSLLASPFAMAENNCVELQKQAVHEYQQQNVQQLQRTQNQMQGSSCSAPQKTYVERQLAYLMYNNLVKKGVSGQAMVKGMRSILHQNHSFWPALVSLANYYHDLKNFNVSAEYYAQALDAINDGTKTLDKDAPSAQIMQTLRKNSELDLLAADHPPVCRGCRSSSDGLMSFKYKTVRARKKQLPIHFNSGKDELVGNDLRYARQLYRTLHKQGDPNITLFGHTDPAGAASMNLKLSRKRAKTVRLFLESRGYKGNIRSDGKGEAVPLYDPRGNAVKHYGKTRWYRMLRRVEIRIH